MIEKSVSNYLEANPPASAVSFFKIPTQSLVPFSSIPTLSPLQSVLIEETHDDRGSVEVRPLRVIIIGLSAWPGVPQPICQVMRPNAQLSLHSTILVFMNLSTVQTSCLVGQSISLPFRPFSDVVRNGMEAFTSV